MKRSKFDPNQISQYGFDDELGAHKVHINSGEMSVQLNADDGDSVRVESRVFESSLLPNQEVHIEPCSKLAIYAQCLEDCVGSIKIQISPKSSGNCWIDMDNMSLDLKTNDCVLLKKYDDVIAKRLRVISDCHSKLEIMLLGKGL